MVQALHIHLSSLWLKYKRGFFFFSVKETLEPEGAISDLVFLCKQNDFWNILNYYFVTVIQKNMTFQIKWLSKNCWFWSNSLKIMYRLLYTVFCCFSKPILWESWISNKYEPVIGQLMKHVLCSIQDALQPPSVAAAWAGGNAVCQLILFKDCSSKQIELPSVVLLGGGCVLQSVVITVAPNL